MSKRFLTVVEAIDVLDDLSDHEDTELVVHPPENKGYVTNEENDDENLRETRVIQEVAGEVEVFHPSLKSDQQQANPTTAKKQKRRKVEKIRWKKNKKLENAFPEDILEPVEKAHPEILYLALYDLFKLYFDEDAFSHITIEFERYAKQKLNHSFSLSEADLDVF